MLALALAAVSGTITRLATLVPLRVFTSDATGRAVRRTRP